MQGKEVQKSLLACVVRAMTLRKPKVQVELNVAA